MNFLEFLLAYLLSFVLMVLIERIMVKLVSKALKQSYDLESNEENRNFEDVPIPIKLCGTIMAIIFWPIFIPLAFYRVATDIHD